MPLLPVSVQATVMYHLLLDHSRQIPNSGYLGGELSEASAAQLTGWKCGQGIAKVQHSCVVEILKETPSTSWLYSMPVGHVVPSPGHM